MIELENERRYLNQWGLEQRVLIDGFLPGTWVDFSHVNDCKNSALTTEAYVEAGHVYANIPNVLLQLPGFLHVYVNPDASDMAHTPEERDIKIVRRAKPAHYIYTETPTVSYSSKVDIFWGTEHAGKTMIVGEDGYLTVAEKTSGGTGDDDVATDDEVNDMFDDVFDKDEGSTEDDNTGGGSSGGDNTSGGGTTGDEEVNGDIATDEEVNDMFDDIFG